jgi:hypothetical protein
MGRDDGYVEIKSREAQSSAKRAAIHEAVVLQNAGRRERRLNYSAASRSARG